MADGRGPGVMRSAATFRPAFAPLPGEPELARRQAALAGLGPLRLGQIEALAPGLDERQADAAMQAVRQPRSRRSRLAVAIRRVDELHWVVQPLAACRRGCAHCCHIRVEMTQLEAERLGEAIGRKPNTRHRYVPVEEGANGRDTPCPFLKDGECSVHDLRPFACRKNHNLDADEPFCRLDLPAQFAASVPRVQARMALLVSGSAIAASRGVADIREWSLGPRELARGPVGRIASAREMLEQAAEQEPRP